MGFSRWLRRNWDKFTGDYCMAPGVNHEWLTIEKAVGIQGFCLSGIFQQDRYLECSTIVEVFECRWCHERKAEQRTDAPQIPGSPNFSYKVLDPDIALAMIENNTKK